MVVGMWEQELTLEERIVEWATLEKNAAEDADFLRSTPRIQFWERRSLRDSERRLRELAAAERAELPEDAVRDLAWELLHRIWWRTAGELSTRNAYHRDLEVERETRAAAVAKEARETWLQPAFGRGGEKLRVDQVPGLAPLLEPGPARLALREIARLTREVANDAVMLTRSGVDRDGDPMLVVQHKASGLRAVFTENHDQPGTGTVFSKPYSIDSIDPEMPGTLGNWERYVGMGIGTRIYLEAARLKPAVRWSGTATSIYSEAVRRKLHARDPWRWYAYCQQCESRGIVWHEATRADFTGHAMA